MSDFVKRDDLEFSDQLRSFHSGLGIYGTTLGFSVTEIADADSDATLFTYLVQRQSDMQGFGQDLSRYKNLARYGNGEEVLGAIPQPAAYPTPLPTVTSANIEARFRQRAAKAKSSAAYTKAIGESLKIEAPESTFDPTTGQPTFSIFVDSGHPVLKWVKGKFEGVEIWVDRGSGFAKLERDNRSPYADTHPLPAAGQTAVWKYKMIYLFKDAPTGRWSSEVSVTVYGEV